MKINSFVLFASFLLFSFMLLLFIIQKPCPSSTKKKNKIIEFEFSKANLNKKTILKNNLINCLKRNKQQEWMYQRLFPRLKNAGLL